MEFIRRKCFHAHCPAMACPSATGYCSYHDLQRTPLGQRPKAAVALPQAGPWLTDARPISSTIQ